MDAFIVIAVATCMIAVTSLLFYELTRVIWDSLPKLPMKPRLRILVLIGAIWVAHTLAIWLYAGMYWLMIHYTGLGGMSGENWDGSFMSILYFSASTYSSLGYGDIVATGPLRQMAGIQVVNGLMLIGWSVSITYLAMEKFWDMHRSRRGKDAAHDT